MVPALRLGNLLPGDREPTSALEAADEAAQVPVHAGAENIAEAGGEHEKPHLVVFGHQHAEQDQLGLEREDRGRQEGSPGQAEVFSEMHHGTPCDVPAGPVREPAGMPAYFACLRLPKSPLAVSLTVTGAEPRLRQNQPWPPSKPAVI